MAVLEEGDEFTPFDQISPQDQELILSRKFGAEDVGRWFRVPPHKIALLDRATFSNTDSMSQDYIDSALMAWAVQAEQECDLKLFG